MTIKSMTPEESAKYLAPASSPFSPTFAFTVTSWPKQVGGYQMGDIQFNLTRKPSWWHRLGVRLVLGWRWVDTP